MNAYQSGCAATTNKVFESLFNQNSSQPDSSLIRRDIKMEKHSIYTFRGSENRRDELIASSLTKSIKDTAR